MMLDTSRYAIEGKLCEAAYTSGSLGNGDVLYLNFKPPASSGYLITGASYLSYGGSAVVGLSYNAEISEQGSEVPSTRYSLPYQDNSGPTMKVYSGSTVSDVGDSLISFSLFGSSSFINEQASAVAVDSVRPLKPGSEHLIKITSGASGVFVQVFLEWVEI